MTDIMSVRLVNKEELDLVNVLRKQVYDLHAQGKPSVFNPEFSEELRDYIYSIWNDPRKDIVVSEREGSIVGYAVLHHIHQPKSPFMIERDYLDIDEFCVDVSFRRCGVATEMINYIRDYASERDIHRIEMNVWAFNEKALAFYESIGFTTYRRYMEMTC